MIGHLALFAATFATATAAALSFPPSTTSDGSRAGMTVRVSGLTQSEVLASCAAIPAPSSSTARKTKWRICSHPTTRVEQ